MGMLIRFPDATSSGVVLSCYTEVETLKVALDQFSDVVWYSKEL